ncbi:hypothetical protein [Streptomyces sp. NPDC001678]|uniref:hypothetical protein n=1 Tax=Streptomyces sp. NPDC001678 TaxID=3364599 RepID=UPI0036836715
MVLGLPALGGVLSYITSYGQDHRHQASSPASGRDGGKESERYRLSVPRTLLDGQYTLVKDLSQTMDDSLADERNGRNEHNMKTVGGQYTATSGEGQQTLMAAGSYGEIDDPQRALDSTFRGMNENEGVTVTTPAREFTPPGAQEPLSCEVYAYTRSGQSGSISVCGWSDRSTVATVSVLNGGPVDLDELAMKTSRIRGEMRVLGDQGTR